MFNIIALIGKAGSGKDTFLKTLIAAHPELHPMISYTTRPSRSGETEGKDYYFINDKQFLELVDNNQMFEYTQFNSWYYGTGIQSVREDKLNIGVLNPAGIKNLLKRDDVNLKVFMIDTDDGERIIRQLSREEKPNTTEIIRRYETDKKDFLQIHFDYEILLNTTMEDFINSCARLEEVIARAEEDNT